MEEGHASGPPYATSLDIYTGDASAEAVRGICRQGCPAGGPEVASGCVQNENRRLPPRRRDVAALAWRRSEVRSWSAAINQHMSRPIWLVLFALNGFRRQTLEAR